MKKITIIFIILVAFCFTAYAQFPEGFETSVPPTGWATFIGINGEGTVWNWEQSTTIFASGAASAFVRYENVATGAEDWLVTPQFTPTAATNILSFQQRQAFTSDWGTTYTVRVSIASQTTHGDFAIIDTQTELDFGVSFASHFVDLSAYDGMPIYVAFVMSQDDGDNWYIDDVDLISNATAPGCSATPIPTDLATNVLIPGGSLTLSWDAPTTGDPATDYEFFFGTDQDVRLSFESDGSGMLIRVFPAQGESATLMTLRNGDIDIVKYKGDKSMQLAEASSLPSTPIEGSFIYHNNNFYLAT